MNNLSVVICTYNPSQHIFASCLEAIVEATKLYNPLEIIVVDNNSNNNFFDEEYFKNFMKRSNTTLIHEKKQGLTPARLRGIEASSGEIIVFIDDDNVIDANFFIEGMKIANEYSFIGAWSGQVRLIFEEKPPEWTKKYWGLLVYREFSINKWSNLPHNDETMPCGAGLFVRKEVASRYTLLHLEGKRFIQLDRSATSLLSAGDNDLAACACDLGMGVGLFRNISIQHFIPKSRLELQYLLKLTTGIAASSLVFKSFRGEMPPNKTWKNKIANTLRLALMTSRDRAFYSAVLKGHELGVKLLKHEKHN